MDELGQFLRDALGNDLAEFREFAGLVRIAVRLALAAVLGGLLGVERTIRRRPAGLRTYMLVALGAAGFVSVPEQLGMPLSDLSRVVQGLLTGVGFLGAGVIFREGGRLQAKGLTTAAGIWLTAAIGMAVGLGRPATAALIAVLALTILSPLMRVESKIERKRGDSGENSNDSPRP
ncbi:MgtC/SapB family protein [Tautonia sociabilis]|uniref:MgtC/SapB family protein n=1 Tax=Tautonia sociabilis TaxID=2080755 RepID=A0A432MK57_9BACT|nr:MgtC/SapB family protein [Tautonia sociabilis]